MTVRVAIVLTGVCFVVGCAPFRGGEGEFDRLVKLIEERYVQEIDSDSLTAAARVGLLSTLDPYSEYLDEAAYSALRQMIDGEFGGVGIRVDVDSTTAQVRIAGTLVDSPARAVGIKQNDVIVAIDGEHATGRPIEEVIARIQGKVGTTVELGIERPGEPEVLHFDVRRAIIHTGTVRGMRRLPSGPWDYLVDAENRIGYVRILSFADRTPEEFDSAVAEVHRAGARAFVLDLRSTPGGLARAAIEVADRLLDSGVIVTMRHRNQDDDVRRAEPGVSTRLPLALLIDEATASSAEILASALQDHGRAIVLGSRSFGKGVGQELLELDGGRAMKLTTFEYIRPSGAPMERHFHGIEGVPFAGIDSTRGGVWPDSGLVFALSPEEYELWSNSTWVMDDWLMMAEAPTDSLPEPRDRVLERAVDVLRALPVAK